MCTCIISTNKKILINFLSIITKNTFMQGKKIHPQIAKQKRKNQKEK